MKVHSQGCMEVLTHHMRDNITTLVGLIVATLFIQVTYLVTPTLTKASVRVVLHLLQARGQVIIIC